MVIQEIILFTYFYALPNCAKKNNNNKKKKKKKKKNSLPYAVMFSMAIM